jgi:hypothetical protein
MHWKFFHMFKDEEQSMQAWIASVWHSAYRLEAADFEVTDIDLIIVLTQGLPDCFDPSIVSLDTTPIDQLSVDSVITCLLNEESRQSCTDPGPDVAALAHSRLDKKTWSKPSKAQSVTNEERSPRSLCCYNCGGRGHLACDCPSPKQEGDKPNLARDDDTSSQFSPYLLLILTFSHSFDFYICLSAHFCFIGCVGNWRISTHRLFTTLHNPIIVDFPHRLVASYLLL